MAAGFLASIKSNWMILSALAALSFGWGESLKEQAVLTKDIDVLKAVPQISPVDIRDIRDTSHRTEAQVGELKGQTEGIIKRMDDFNERLLRYEGRLK